MSSNNLYREKDIFLPGNICNNNYMIWQNQNLFKRNFVLPTNVKNDKLYYKHMYITPRSEASGQCTNSKHINQLNELKNKIGNPQKCKNQDPSCLSCCSGFAGVINQESDLFLLDYLDTKCPSKKYQMPIMKTNVPISKCPPQPTDNDLVGIKNPSQEMCPQSEWAIVGPSQFNVRNVCSDQARLNECEYNNYLKGPNAAGAETDISYNLNFKQCSSNKPLVENKNKWIKFTEISNLSSDIPYKPIRDQLVDYTYYNSDPFMLEDVRVRKIPPPKIQECTNLFNNMTRRKCLFHENK